MYLHHNPTGLHPYYAMYVNIQELEGGPLLLLLVVAGLYR